MDDIQLRLDCVRIASDNLRVSIGQALDEYIFKGTLMKEAA